MGKNLKIPFRPSFSEAIKLTKLQVIYRAAVLCREYKSLQFHSCTVSCITTFKANFDNHFCHKSCKISGNCLNKIFEDYRQVVEVYINHNNNFYPLTPLWAVGPGIVVISSPYCL